MPWLVWLAAWIANRVVYGNLIRIGAEGLAWAFDTIDNILPYAQAFNEFVNTLYAAWTSGTFPNVVYFEAHGNFYRWDFPRPYTVEMPHFPQAFVASQAGLLKHYYKTSAPFLFYDLASIVEGDTIATGIFPEVVTQEEDIQAANIMGNVYDVLGDRSDAYCNNSYNKPDLSGGYTVKDAFPYNNCVRWQSLGGWSYKAKAFDYFRKFSPFKADGSVYLRGTNLYYYTQSTNSLTLFYSPRNPNVLFDDYGPMKRNQTDLVYFDGQIRPKGDNSGLDVYRSSDGQWHHLYFFSNI